MAELEMIQVLPIQDMENQEHAYSDFDVKAKDKLVIIEGYRCSFMTCQIKFQILTCC